MKAVVEDCLVLSMSELIRARVLVPGSWTSGAWGWHRQGEEWAHATLRYEADLTDPAQAWLRLRYRVADEPVDDHLQLVTTRPTYGGLRWWFLCPLPHQDAGLPRRVGKLYLPPGGRSFGSRAAYNLTYVSCQKSGKYRRLDQLLSARAGPSGAVARHAKRQRAGC